MEIREVVPAHDEPLARELLALQRAAYAVEAALLGDDRIPALHEDLDALRDAPGRWWVAVEAQRLAGAVAWLAGPTSVDIDRLVVSPANHRQGIGRRLVQAVLAAASERRVSVSTGRDNAPARRLYESLGFVRTGEEEVVSGLWVTHYARAAGPADPPG